MNEFDVIFAIEDAGFVRNTTIMDRDNYFSKDDIVVKHSLPYDGNDRTHLIRAMSVNVYDTYGYFEVEEYVRNRDELDDLLNSIESRLIECREIAKN